MTPSAHLDSFARDNLPPRAQWPDFLFDLPELKYPDRINCAVDLLDRWIATGHGDRPCLISPAESLSYAQLAERVNRIANVLTRDLGLVPGHRVLLRGPNSPMMVAAYLAVIKAGGVVVATMPLLRAKEIAYPITKAKIRARALRSPPGRRDGEDKAARRRARTRRLLGQRHARRARSADGEARLRAFHRLRHRERRRLPDRLHLGHDRRAERHHAFPPRHAGDLRQLRPPRAARRSATDRFIGSPPLAFTFGLGGLVLFPLRVGAATILLERAGPDDLLAAVAQFGATVCFTAPTAYRAMLAKLAEHDISSLRKCVSAGETLPQGHVRRLAHGDRHQDPRRHRRDRDAAHLHRLARGRDPRRAPPAGRCRATRRAWSTTTATRSPPNTLGRLAVRGPTGCRYLADKRQRDYVQRRLEHHRRHLPHGCRRLLLVPGALRRHDRLGRLQHRRPGGRDGAAHPSGGRRMRRGRRARRGARADRQGLCRAASRTYRRRGLDQARCRTTSRRAIAPYKYPRAIEYVTALPRTQTGKLQRFELRRLAGEPASRQLAS